MRYRVTAVTGALQESFTGAADPVRQVLDNCGVLGTADLTLLPHAQTLDLTASRIVRRRVGPAGAIADLHAGRLRFGSGVFIAGGSARVAVAEALQRAGTTICHDTRAISTNLALSSTAAGFVVSIGSPVFGTPNDAIRTHCPGPDDTEVFGAGQGFVNGRPTPSGAFAEGAPRSTRLGAPSIIVSLSRGGRFSGFDYVGSRGGAVALTLSLARLRAGTVRERFR